MLSNGNSKLGRDIFNFNLPRVTCEKVKTVLCDQYCYAKRGHFLYSNVKNALDRNLKLTKKKNFVDIIDSQIKFINESKGNLKYVRLHSSGEFYSQSYFEKWNTIAEKNKNITFLAYTRNWKIDFSKKQSNFQIFYSVDNSTQKINKTLKQISKVIFKGEKTTEKICESKCHSCKYCFNTTKNVVFLKH